MCGLCCFFVSQNMPVTLKQNGAMFWQGLTGAATSWSRIVLWLLIIVQTSLKACARVFGKQCGCVFILQQSSSTQKHPSPKWTIITTSIYTHGNTYFFFSEDVKHSQIPFQCDQGTCWWEVSSSGSSLDYTKQLAGPQWHAFNRYHAKSKETVMWTLRSVLVICVSKCEVWRDQWPWNSSYCDFRKKNLEWIRSGVGKRRNRSVSFIYVVPDWLLICFGFCWNYFSTLVE